MKWKVEVSTYFCEIGFFFEKKWLNIIHFSSHYHFKLSAFGNSRELILALIKCNKVHQLPKISTITFSDIVVVGNLNCSNILLIENLIVQNF